MNYIVEDEDLTAPPSYGEVLSEPSGSPHGGSTSAVLLSDIDVSNYVELEDFLCEAAYGQIYRGQCVKIPATFARALPPIAIRFINTPPTLSTASQRVMEFTALKERLIRELKTWQNLKHQHITRVFGYAVFDTFPNQFLLVTQWGELGNARQYLQAKPNVPRPPIVDGITDALTYLHEQGVVHGSLQPDNILISESGVPVLYDFGIRKIVENSTSWSKDTISWRYTAPEVLLDGPLNFAADVYSYSLTSYKIMTSVTPFSGWQDEWESKRNIINGRRPDQPPNHTVLPTTWDVWTHCWNPDPSRRPSMVEVCRLMSRPGRDVASHLFRPSQQAASTENLVLISGGDDFIVKVFDVESRRALLTLENHRDRITCVAFFSDGSKIVSGSADKVLRIWDRAYGREIRSLIGHGGEVSCVAVSPSGSQIASGSIDKTIRIWEANSGRLLHQCSGHLDGILSLYFGEELVVSVSADRTARIWKASTGKHKQTYKLYEDSMICCAAVFWYGGTVASGLGNGTIEVFDYAISKRKWLLGHHNAVSVLEFSPTDTTLLASGSIDGTIRFWDHRSGTLTKVISHDGDWPVSALAFSKDGMTLASGSNDGRVRVWDVETGTMTKVWVGHSKRVSYLTF